MSIRNALILAAGRGRRLGEASQGLPKSLLPVGGKSILERQLDALNELGVERFAVVVGFQQERFRRRIQRSGVSWVENPRYASTDLFESFRLGMHALEDGGWLLLADTLLRPELLRRMAASSADLVLGLDRHPCGDEEMKLRLEDGRAVRMSKEIDPARADGEFVGVALLRGAGLERLRSVIRAQAEEGETRFLFERAFQALMDRRDPGLDVVDVTGEPWVEVDFPEDLARARELFR